MILTENIKNLSINSKLFLDYISSFGFNPNNYENIIEVNGKGDQSISQFLKEYNQFLISKKTIDNDLRKLNIKGANGYINKLGIVIQDDNKDKLLYNPSRGIHQVHLKGYPVITDNDVIIANGINMYMNNLKDYRQDKYLGFCMDIDNPELETTYYRFRDLQIILNSNSNNEEYVLEHDSLSQKGKAMLLLRKKSR